MRFDFLYLAFHNCRCHVWCSPYPTPRKWHLLHLTQWTFSSGNWILTLFWEVPGRRGGDLVPSTWYMLVTQAGRSSVPPITSMFSPLLWSSFLSTSLKYLEGVYTQMLVRVTWSNCCSLCSLDPEGWSVPRPECCKTQHSPDLLTLSSACFSAQSCLLPC